MFTGGRRIVDIMYHVKNTLVALAEKGKVKVPASIMKEVDDTKNQKPDFKGRYIGYVDSDVMNETGESSGIGHVFNHDGVENSFFGRFIENGKPVAPKVMMDLSEAINPITGEKIRKDVKGRNADGTDRKQTVAYDGPASIPKDWSILWATGRILRNIYGKESKLAAAVEEIQRRAVLEMAQWMFDEGFFVGRKNNRDKKGKNKTETVRALEIAMAMYDHKISREGDPQVHTHMVILNLCRLAGQEIRTLDNIQMMRWQKAITRIYNTAVAKGTRELLGLEVIENKDWISIPGISNELRDNFSKGKKKIDAKAKENGQGGSSKSYRDQLALSVRNTKDEIPPLSELEPLWQQQMLDLGVDVENFEEYLHAESEKVRKERAGQEAVDVEKLKTKAHETLNETLAVYEERQLAAEFLKSYQIHADGTADAIGHWNDLRKSGETVVLQHDRYKDPIVTSLKILELEAEIVEIGRKMVGCYDRLAPAHIVEMFIAKRQKVQGEPAVIVENAMNAALKDAGVDEHATSKERRVFGRLREEMTKKGGFNRKQLDAVIKAFEDIAIRLDDTVSPEINEAINKFREIADNCPMMSEEQADFVRHLLGSDGIMIGEGSAGSGKTYALKTVCDILRAVGKDPHVISLSWRATDTARVETETKEANARAIQGFINRHKKGEIVIDENHPIIVDEAGMVGHENMLDLQRIALENNTRLILTGDRRQIQPVAAGNPMGILADILGVNRISQIRRQKYAWMRENSTKFASGKTDLAIDALKDYDARGFMQWFDNGDLLIEKAAEDYAKKLIEHPQASFLAMHPVNSMVRNFNEHVREKLREVGVIAPEAEEIKMDCIVRGADAQTMPVGFARGDRIILGETIELDGVRYANGQIATIKNVWKDSDGEIYFKLAFDDGKVRTFSRTDFIRHRELMWKKKTEAGEKNVEPLYPKLQHAFATTETSAQGMTVDYAFILDPHHSYVAGTRHRWGAWFYANFGAAHDILMSVKGGAMKISQDGSMVSEEDEKRLQDGTITRKGENGVTITEAEVKEEAFKAMTQHGPKWNAYDYFKEPEVFLAFAYEKLKVKATKVTESVSKSLKQTFLDAFDTARQSFANAMPDFTSSVAEAIEEVEFDNDNASALESEDADMKAGQQKSGKQKWVGGKSERRLITESETREFERHNMLDFAFNRLGADWKFKGREKGRKSPKWGGQEYEVLISGESVVVNHRRDGTWSFWVRGEKADGNRLWNLAARYLGMSKIEAMHDLRKEVGTSPDPVEMERMVVEGKFQDSGKVPDFKEQPLHEQLEAAWLKDYRGSIEAWDATNDEEVADKENALSRFDRAVQKWSYRESGISDYLLERGLTAKTQKHFAGDFKLANKTYDKLKVDGRTVPGEVLFGLRDRANKIVGYFLKGREGKGMASDVSGGAPTFMGYRGGRKAITGERVSPSHIILVEAHIDGMSYWQHIGSPENALIISSTGQVGEQTQAAAYMYAKHCPEAEIHIAPDSDRAGYRFFSKYLDAVEAGRERAISEGYKVPVGDIIDARPGLEWNDWNNRIRGIKSTDTWKPPVEGDEDFNPRRDVEFNGPVPQAPELIVDPENKLEQSEAQLKPRRKPNFGDVMKRYQKPPVDTGQRGFGPSLTR
ncbi:MULTISPECIES: MobF family relaxase [unclassified Pannonibacter]|uniref:MobF family relaxase n=1 Tax=unclassified Pannonibacter TaxID=2627228 RepID=UPI001645893E|nr:MULTISPECIES: MobF family relaxase [unclassified Pannonibacter]